MRSRSGVFASFTSISLSLSLSFSPLSLSLSPPSLSLSLIPLSLSLSLSLSPLSLSLSPSLSPPPPPPPAHFLTPVTPTGRRYTLTRETKPPHMAHYVMSLCVLLFPVSCPSPMLLNYPFSPPRSLPLSRGAVWCWVANYSLPLPGCIRRLWNSCAPPPHSRPCLPPPPRNTTQPGTRDVPSTCARRSPIGDTWLVFWTPSPLLHCRLLPPYWMSPPLLFPGFPSELGFFMGLTQLGKGVWSGPSVVTAPPTFPLSPSQRLD